MSQSKEIVETGKDLEVKFPLREFTKDDEPHPEISINYFSKPVTLFDALKVVLYDDEWEELKDSRLGVFVHYYESDIKWASRLVHYVLGFQLVCKKKHEIWSLIGAKPIRFSLNEFAHITGLNCDYKENLMYPEVEVTNEMIAFWELLGVGSDAAPTYDQLIEACSDRCIDWSRDDRLRLGYLCILAAFIDAKSHTSAINLNLSRLVMDLDKFVDYPWGRVTFKTLITHVKRVDITRTYHLVGFAQVLQSWVFFALPKYAEEYGQPTKTKQAIPLLAFGGAKGRKNMKPQMVKQTQVVSFVEKDFGDMFPQWEDDGKDERVENILKAFYGKLSKKPWIWRPDHWEKEGVKVSNNKVVVKKEAGHGFKREAENTEEDGCTSKKARIESSFDEFHKRMTESFEAVLDSRLKPFEQRVYSELYDINYRLELISVKVEEIHGFNNAAKGGEGSDNKGGEADNGCEAKVTAKVDDTAAGAVDGVSLPPLLLPHLKDVTRKERSKKVTKPVEPDDNEKPGNIPRKSERLVGRKFV